MCTALPCTLKYEVKVAVMTFNIKRILFRYFLGWGHGGNRRGASCLEGPVLFPVGRWEGIIKPYAAA